MTNYIKSNISLDQRKMNILVISNCSLDSSQGSGYIICGFAEGLKARGHQVKAFGPEDFIFIPKARAAKRLRLFIGYTFKSITEIWQNKSSYVIVELWGGVGWLTCMILSRFRLGSYQVVSRSNGLEPYYRIATTADEDSSNSKFIDKFESLIDKIGFQSADTLTVVSKSEETFANRCLYQKSSRLLLLENALPNNWLNQITHKRKTFTIGFVGGWLDRKGRNQLIGVVNALTAMGSGCKWMIAGVGKEGKIDLLENTKLPSYSIYNQISRSELKDLYHEMSVLLCLSSYESFGLMCSEAMSCGCMLMSTKVGFASGLREGIDYICIDRYNVNDIASKLIQIENGYLDHESIAESGYKRVQGLNWESNVNKLEQHYKSLMLGSV